MNDNPIALDLDLGDLPDTAVAFVSQMADQLRYQCPTLFAALAKTLEAERDQRRRDETGAVLFVTRLDGIDVADQAARTALCHAALSADCAKLQTDPAAGDAWVAMARMFFAIHTAIVEAVDPDDLLAYRLSTFSPPTAA